MSYLVGAVLAVLGVVGLLLVAQGVVGTTTPERRSDLDWRRLRRRTVLGSVAFVAGIILSGWTAIGLMAAAIAVLVPDLIAARRAREAGLALTEALAGWAEMLRDTIGSHAGLREAIGVTSEVAPEPIRPAVQRLAARAEHESLSVGLARFADEVADPVGDLIVAALGVAADGQARNLPALLSRIATSARSEAHMRLRVETGRARTYSSSRALVLITLGLSLLLLFIAPDFMAPFSTVTGQVVLSMVGGLFGAALWGLMVLGRPAENPRLLAGVAEAARGASP